MDDGNGASLGGRILLALLTLYALAMIAPDLIRIVRPLGAFGLATNADGLIYDVRGSIRRRRGFARVAGGPASRRSPRHCGDALRPDRHRDLRHQSRALGRVHLRPAGPRGDAAARSRRPIARLAR